MKATWKIKTLVYGHHTLDKSALTHNSGLGVDLTFPVLGLAIENDEHRIIVDTGHYDPEWLTENRVRATTAPDEFIDVAIRDAMGWSLDDVDIVINTHLHFDHCANNRLFKNAKFMVSRAEWEYAFHPYDHQLRLYMPEFFDKTAINYFDWVLLDGDTNLFPGLSLIMTPGHTPGHMSVLINTDEGVVCYAGDACNMVENINDNVVSNVVVNPADMLKSLHKIRCCASYIIPGHEPLIKKGQSGGFPGIL